MRHESQRTVLVQHTLTNLDLFFGIQYFFLLYQHCTTLHSSRHSLITSLNDISSQTAKQPNSRTTSTFHHTSHRTPHSTLPQFFFRDPQTSITSVSQVPWKLLEQLLVFRLSPKTPTLCSVLIFSHFSRGLSCITSTSSAKSGERFDGHERLRMRT